MNLIRFKNNDASKVLNSFFNDFEDLTNDFFGRIKGDVGRTNVIETENQYQLDLLMPGAVKEKITLDITDNVLNVGYKNEENVSENKENYVRQEWSYAEFNRQFLLPENVDKGSIDASYKDGVLKLTINKIKEVVKPSNRIEIK